jgi:aminoglycoside phosphotransferase family enzyme/predicted kinase
VTVDNQAETIEFLSNPATYGVTAVDRQETHLSIVFLAGRRAYKLKRAVRFDYVDFSTIEQRRSACHAELALNKRTAPAFYLDVKPITRKGDGSVALGGEGEALDWVVEMVRFDQEALLDRLAAREALDVGLMPPLGEAIARFHEGAEQRADHGGFAGMRWVIDGNADGFGQQGKGILDVDACERLTARTRGELADRSDLLEMRRANGSVRWCHGDLHLRNVFVADGKPVLFDAIEFNSKIACIDVLYDVAFLLMDLWRRHLPLHANTVFNAYLSITEDIAGLRLLPLFLSCRAAVRAKTSATSSAMQSSPERTEALRATAREYLTMAGDLLRPHAPRLIAIGGLSGSGKSTLAVKLAPGIGAVPGALVIRSDIERKRLLGVPPASRLGEEGYTAEVSDRVYRRIEQKVLETLRAGHSALVDAVFASPADREALVRAAREANVQLTGVWLDADPSIMTERLRHRVGDASDATAAVLEAQLKKDLGQIDWTRVDASGDEAETLRRVERVLEGKRGGHSNASA